MSAGRFEQGDAALTSGEVTVRPYTPADDADLDALQHNSSMEHRFGRWLNTYLRVATQEKGGYNARALDFDDHVILVAQTAAQGATRIVGVINVGIKPVFVGGQQQTSGFLYGLRVHEAVQGAGVGLRLLQGAEHGAAQKGCTRMLLTVNDDNKKARRFFERSGYTLASQRVLSFSILLSLGPRPAHAELVQVHDRMDRKAVSAACSHHKTRDMTPNIDTLIECPPFVGTLSAVSADGQSQAGAFLWDGSLRKRFCASGRIPELLNSSSWPLIRSALMVSVGGVWLWHVSAMVTAGRLSFLACEALVEMAVAYGAYKAYSLVSFALTRQMKAIRVFGYYASGVQGRDLLRAVYWKAREIARDDYMGSHLIVNADQQDPLLPCFDGKIQEAKTPKKKKTFTRFLHKDLVLPADKAGSGSSVSILGQACSLARLSADMFFDPRDI